MSIACLHVILWHFIHYSYCILSLLYLSYVISIAILLRSSVINYTITCRVPIIYTYILLINYDYCLSMFFISWLHFVNIIFERNFYSGYTLFMNANYYY